MPVLSRVRRIRAVGPAGRLHKAPIRTRFGDAFIGHASRSSTAIEARKKLVKTEATPVPAPRKRGRPRKGEVRPHKPPVLSVRQFGMSMKAMLADLPRSCNVGSKCNSQGFNSSWIGYRLHLDVADGMIPISAVLTSARVHDSQFAIPLATMSAQRGTHCYDLMDAAYCSSIIRAHCKSLGHVPLIEHNPRGGSKLEFAPHQAQRYKERSTGRPSDQLRKERLNSLLSVRQRCISGPVWSGSSWLRHLARTGRVDHVLGLDAVRIAWDGAAAPDRPWRNKRNTRNF